MFNMAPSLGIPGLYSVSSNNTSSLIGRSNIDLFGICNHTDLTNPCSSAFVSSTFAIDHWFLPRSLSFNNITSPSLKFRFSVFHFCLGCRLCRNSFRHLFQNSLVKCCTRLHLRLQYKSARWNFPGGDNTIFDFPVRSAMGMSKGENGSLRVSTVSGQLLMLASVSHSNVRNPSSFRRSPCSFNREDRMLRMDLI